MIVNHYACKRKYGPISQHLADKEVCMQACRGRGRIVDRERDVGALNLYHSLVFIP